MNQRYVTRIVKVVFAVSTVSFVLLHSIVRSPPSDIVTFTESSKNDERKLESAHYGDSDVQHHEGSPVSADGGIDSAVAKNSLNKLSADIYDQAETQSHVMPSLADIQKSIEFNNEHTEMQNTDKFAPITNSTVVIVVQVHDRAKYLEMLVQSLEHTRGIDEALLIFSHDYYSPEINLIIKNIKFCKVMQIFFPYNIQLFPNQFPGQSVDDCPTDITKETAAKTKCLNWEHPDKYGHYRVAKYSQIKHHWWWKMNYVWHGVNLLRNFTGYVLLLEEDHFVSPDMLYVLNTMIINKDKLCAECAVLSVGTYLKTYAQYRTNIDRLAIHPFFSSKHNMGLAFDRSTWQVIRNCSDIFCTYDDYNWDWSLMPIATRCFNPRLHVLFTKSPRVFHIGDCGVHTHKCRADASAKKVVEHLQSVQDQLFPAKISVTERSRRTMKPPKENGGWGDIRDHQLCLNISSSVFRR